MKPTRVSFLAGLVGGGILGLLGGVLPVVTVTFADPKNREGATLLLARTVDGWGCTDLGTRGPSWADSQAELLCLAVARTELAPGHTITRADLHGIRISPDYVPNEVLQDPVGAVVTRRILAGESVRAERVQGGTP